MPIMPDFMRAVTTGDVRVIDLTDKLSEHTPTQMLPEPFGRPLPFSLDEISAYDERGPEWKHANITMCEHVGTHVCGPTHWYTGRDGRDISEIPPERLIGPAAVLDFSAEAAENPDFLLDVAHVEAWEAEHGPFESGTWLLLRTGWDAYSHDAERFLNAADDGAHTPGFTAELARWIAERPEISGIGTETVGIDAGQSSKLEPPAPIHYYLFAADKYGVTQLQNLGELPPRGAMIVIAPLPIVGGTGGPARVYALVDRAAR